LSTALADPANGFRLRLSFAASRAYAQRVKAAKADYGENKRPYYINNYPSGQSLSMPVKLNMSLVAKQMFRTVSGLPNFIGLVFCQERFVPTSRFRYYAAIGATAALW